MNNNSEQPLILTLKLDAASSTFFDALRREHFPDERNFLAAHLTLFHNLPGQYQEKIENNLRDLCSRYKSFPLHFPTWRFLGKGAAIEVESSELLSLCGELKSLFDEWLTAQDRQKFKPHITVQNKVAPEIARTLFDGLSANWSGKTGTGIGIELWHYLKGPWKLAKEFAFK